MNSKSSKVVLKTTPTAATGTIQTNNYINNKKIYSNNLRSNSIKRSDNNGSYNLQKLIDDIKLGNIQNIIVLTGAGISTPSGIPDFRSPGTGLYNNLQKYHLPYAEAIFEKDYFIKNPKPFYILAKELYPNLDKHKPNKIHYFLRLLQEKNLLKRLYTQNIDGLERLAGVLPNKLIEAHGSFRTARCIKCNKKYDSKKIKDEIFLNKIPNCDIKNCSGLVKPDIIFFGEDLPSRFYEMYPNDMRNTDLVIVMGTSLEVEPFASLLNETKLNIPRLLINRQSVGPFRFKFSNRKDVEILGDLNECLDSFINKLNWTSDLENLIDLSRTEKFDENSYLKCDSEDDLIREMKNLGIKPSPESVTPIKFNHTKNLTPDKFKNKSPPSSSMSTSSSASSASSISEGSGSKPPRIGLFVPNSKPYSQNKK